MVENYAKIVDERGRNLMCDRTLPSLPVTLKGHSITIKKIKLGKDKS